MNTQRYTLTVPTYDNNGASLLALHDKVRAQLAGTFGGFTVTGGRGVWRTSDEPVRVYTVDVAGPCSGTVNVTLWELAEYVAREARQDTVYLTRQPIETWLITTPAECMCGAEGAPAFAHASRCPQYA